MTRTRTPEREREIDFSYNYFITPHTVIVRKNSFEGRS